MNLFGRSVWAVFSTVICSQLFLITEGNIFRRDPDCDRNVVSGCNMFCMTGRDLLDRSIDILNIYCAFLEILSSNGLQTGQN